MTTRRRAKRPQKGFSLIEVVIAMGIFAFGIIGLMGIMGPLLATSQGTVDQADLPQVVALTRAWLAEEGSGSAVDFARTRAELEAGDLVLYLYAWADGESNGERSPAVEWRVGTAAALGTDYARYRSGEGNFASSLYRVALSEEPRLATAAPAFGATSGRPARAEVRAAPALDPGSAFGVWEERVNRTPLVHTFWAGLIAR